MAVGARQYLASDKLLVSTVVTATSTGTTPIALRDNATAIIFELDVTAVATAAGDILAVFVQTTIDGTTNWVDVVAFTTVLGNGGAKRYFAKVTAGAAETMFENASALSAGSVRNLIGDQWRIRYVVTSATAPSFTFSVSACPV